MKNNKGIAITFSTAIIVLNSDILMAADDAGGSLLPPIWPLLALLIIIVVFRKQLNCNPPVDLDEKPVAASKVPTADRATTSAPKKAGTIDLKDGLNRCQASTSKGKRCKRETMLENTSISIDDKTYLLTVCSQHNTKKLKPFSGLIK